MYIFTSFWRNWGKQDFPNVSKIDEWCLASDSGVPGTLTYVFHSMKFYKEHSNPVQNFHTSEKQDEVCKLGSHPIKTPPAFTKILKLILKIYTWENIRESKSTKSKEGKVALSLIRAHL